MRLRAGRRVVEITSPDKLMFPDAGLTKADLVGHYLRVAEVMLPHISRRPLNLWRYPNGIDHPGFLSQQVPDWFPRWIGRVTVAKRGGSVTHATCGEPASLAYIAGQACITPHAWLSRADRLERPDRLTFDLDPSDEDFDLVRAVAQELDSTRLTPRTFTVANLERRLDREGDPWAAIGSAARALGRPRRRLEQVAGG